LKTCAILALEGQTGPDENYEQTELYFNSGRPATRRLQVAKAL